VLLYGERDPQRAVEAFVAAEQLGGNTPTTWLAWAHALDQLGRPADASALLDSYALTGALADTIRANALRQAGHVDEALALYQQVLAENDGDPWIWHALAVTYLQTGNQAAARSAWTEALDRVSDFQPALEGLAALGRD
jgi:predicted Zn-dependent protease